MQPAVPHFAKLKYGTFTKAQTGNMQMALVFDVIHVADAGEWKPLAQPIERTVYLPFTDAAQKYTDDKLVALGFDGNFDSPGFADEPKFEGVELNCRHDTYNGKTNEKWDLAKWGGDRVIEKAPTDAVRQAAAAWKARRGATAPKPNGRPATPPPVPARSSPPPAPSSGGAATLVGTAVVDKDTAWAATCEAWSGNDEAKRNDAWSKALTAACTRLKKPESALTPAEWADLAESTSIPF